MFLSLFIFTNTISPMALPKRSLPKPVRVDTKANDKLTAAQKRKAIIDMLYGRCRVCNFFMERKFPGDNICSSVCKLREMAVKEVGEIKMIINEDNPL
jgi:hypothetical protein